MKKTQNHSYDHASPFYQELAKTFGNHNMKRIQSLKIGIGGAGGLGSNVAANLVRCGFRSFVIADKDVVSVGNLNRQFFFLHQIGERKVDALAHNLLQINPDLNIQGHFVEVTQENIHQLFADCHLLIEAFDDVLSKTLFVEAFSSSGKLTVSVSGLAGWGRSDELTVKKISDTFFIVGDGKSGVHEKNPPVAPRVLICAAKQADIVLEYVLEKLPLHVGE